MKEKPLVYLALSGGVDSAVAGALLLEKGYRVKAFFLKIWSDDVEGLGYCPWVEDRRDAMAVAAQLQIPFETLDFEKEYKEKVFSYFVEGYTSGITPNPDILCNDVIKFGIFLDYAIKDGADYIATGHHVRKSPETGDKQAVYKLLCGIDDKKDQSYFLAGLNQHQLAYSLFPIGDFTKDQVRKKASDLGLDQVASKKSTSGICFIGHVDLKPFLQQYINQKEGDIINIQGEIVGTHDGVAYYTIGQRKGLHIPATNSETKPYFVVEKNAEKNMLIVSNAEKDLMGNKLIAENIHWIRGGGPLLPLTCKARIRYNQNMQEVTVNDAGENKLSVHFQDEQRAITPGQIIVFYNDNELIGSARIV